MAFDRTEETIGYSKKLAYSDTSNGTFITVDGTFELEPPQAELGKAEITNDSSPAYHKDYIPGLYEPGELTFKYRYGKTAFTTLDTVFKLAKVATTRASATKYWKITLPDVGATTGSTIVVQGFITKHAISGLNLEDALEVEGSIQTIGPATFTAAT